MPESINEPAISLPLGESHPCYNCDQIGLQPEGVKACQDELDWESQEFVQKVLTGEATVSSYSDALALQQALYKASEKCQNKR